MRYDKKLFSEISKIINKLISEYYNELAGKKVTTGMVISYASAGDFCRWNPHFHCIILEGGFDADNNFFYLPIGNTDKLTQIFRQRVIELFVTKKLINENQAINLLSWKHSGFSIDNSVVVFYLRKYIDLVF